MYRGVKRIVAGVIIFILGAVVVPAAVVIPLVMSDSQEHQFLVPTTTEITVDEPGRYYLWNNHQTVYDGKTYNKPEALPDGMEIYITDAMLGEQLPFHSNTSISMSDSSGSKRSIGYVDLPSAGPVVIDIQGGDERIVSFEKSRFNTMIGLIVGGLAAAMVLSFLSIGLIVWGIIAMVRSPKQNTHGRLDETIE